MDQRDFAGSKFRVGILSIVMLMLAFGLLWYSTVPNSHLVTTASAATLHGTYNTKFPATENPISEGGNWINGQSVGIDWANIQTTPGLAFGTEKGTINYDDSTALLSGTWGPDQTIQATVHSVNQQSNQNIFEEVELRLRSSLSAHKATGYEVNFRCSKTSNAYTQIVRWNGPLGSFTQLSGNGGSQYGVKDGDVIKASMVGSQITVWLNGVQVDQFSDSSFTSGSPGMGFYVQGISGPTVAADYGFTSFMATDGSDTSSQPPTPPTNLTVTVH